MRPDVRFVSQPKHFWANIRLISQQVGYTVRQQALIKVPTLFEMRAALNSRGLKTHHIVNGQNNPTELGTILAEYFQHRANVLNTFVESRLMDVEQARQTFDRLFSELNPDCPIPMNKQKGEKRAHAYFTGIINMLIEANADGLPCDYDPRELTTVTRDDMPLRTLARRFDGAFTGAVNPIAVWEIKEYYYTTTFGSRVAGGVYETLLDGMELKDLQEKENIEVKHYLMVDSHYTWWGSGRPYLCRILDMLHMGYVDEVLFGHEVVERLPSLVEDWVELARSKYRA